MMKGIYMMLEQLFLKYLALCEQSRHGYVNSLNTAHVDWQSKLTKIMDPIPELLQVLYRTCQGTYRTIEDQTRMDFVPGYRLIHIDELYETCILLNGMITKQECQACNIAHIIPFLSDNASNYICYVKQKDAQECIYDYETEDGLQLMHTSIQSFFETLIAFYEQHVYFLDEDGYLDYDVEREGIVGAKYNPDVAYWR